MTIGNARTHLLHLVSISLAFVLSSLSVLNQAMRSVPEFLGIGGMSSMVLNSAVGVVQGVLTGAVLPRVGEKLSGKRLSFLVTIGLFTNCILPAAAIAFLDTSCLGHWSAFWGPCRNNPQRFDRTLVVHEAFGTLAQVLSSADICDSHQAKAPTTLSTCTQVVLLRLQDVWLPKIIMSGVIIPATNIARKVRNKDSTQVVSAMAGHVAYVMITAGHLPLVMPFLWLGMLITTFLAAVSWHDELLEHNLEEQSIASLLALPQVISALVHVASASGLLSCRN